MRKNISFTVLLLFSSSDRFVLYSYEITNNCIPGNKKEWMSDWYPRPIFSFSIATLTRRNVSKVFFCSQKLNDGSEIDSRVYINST